MCLLVDATDVIACEWGKKKKLVSEKIEQEMFRNVRVLCLVLRNCVEKKNKTKCNVDSSAVTVLEEIACVQLPVSYVMIVCVFPLLPTRILVKCHLVVSE